MEKEGYQIFLNKDGIIEIKAGKDWGSIELMEDLMNDIKKIGKEVPNKVRVLVNIETAPNIPSVSYRKNVVKMVKDTIDEIGYEKISIYGGGIIQRTVTSFLIKAIGLKNIKYFGSEEEAQKWLKEE